MKKLLILVGAAALVTSTQAFADQDTAGQSRQVARSHTISYSDIDLGTKKGAAELKRRVRVAVENVCGTASPQDLVGLNKANHCYRENKRRTSIATARAISRASQIPQVRVADKR